MRKILLRNILELLPWRKPKPNYRAIFATPEGKIVLRDLAKFCRATKPTYHKDDRIQAIIADRRDVWLHIARELDLSPDEVFKLTKEPLGEDLRVRADTAPK